jgi:hypothetical protein
MKRTTYAILAGSLAFGLTAAAASGVAFTIGTVQNVPGTDSDTEVIATSSCTGTYNVTWTIDSNGYVTGYTATRVAPDPDPDIAYCLGVPAYIEVRSSDGGTIRDSGYGTTDGTTGDFTGTFANTFIAQATDVVELEIGPNAGSGI